MHSARTLYPATARRAARASAERRAALAHTVGQTALVAFICACAAVATVGVVATVTDLTAPAANPPISFSCGAYDVTYQAHDLASRSDVMGAAYRGQGTDCTLVANPDFRATR